MKCDYNDPTWLPLNGGCQNRADFALSRHYLAYPSGKVGVGESGRFCAQHVMLPMAQFLADDRKQVFGLSVMRLGEGDKVTGIEQ